MAKRGLVGIVGRELKVEEKKAVFVGGLLRTPYHHRVKIL